MSEREIAAALLGLLEHDQLRVEGGSLGCSWSTCACFAAEMCVRGPGSAAMTVAAFLKHRKTPAGAQIQHPVVIICAGNVADASFEQARRLVDA